MDKWNTSLWNKHRESREKKNHFHSTLYLQEDSRDSALMRTGCCENGIVREEGIRLENEK